MGFSAENMMSAIAGSQSSLFEGLDTVVSEEAIEAIVKAVEKAYASIIAGAVLVLVANLVREIIYGYGCWGSLLLVDLPLFIQTIWCERGALG